MIRALHTGPNNFVPLLDGIKTKGTIHNITAFALYNLAPNFTYFSSCLPSWHCGDSPSILREDNFQKQTFFIVSNATMLLMNIAF